MRSATTQSTRRAVLAGIAAVPAVSLPALASEPDPIFAAIEAHRAAYDGWVRFIYADKKDERQEEANEMLTDADDLAIQLVDIEPTTVAGVAALLAYYAQRMSGRFANDFPEDLQDESGEEGTFAVFLARSAATALKRITAGAHSAA